VDRLRAILLTVIVAALGWVYAGQRAELASGGVTETIGSATSTERLGPASRPARRAAAASATTAPEAAGRKHRRRIPKSAEDYYLQVLARVTQGPGVSSVTPASAALRINKDYAQLFKYLQLDPDVARALVELLMHKQQARWWMYSRLYGWDANLSIHDAMLTAAREREAIEAQIRALLGDDAYEIYDSYADTLPQRRDLEAFKTKLFGAGLDLTWEQEDALLKMMQAESRRAISADEDPVLSQVAALLPEERNVPESEIYMRRLALYNERFLAAAGGILTPEQMKLYEDYLGEAENQDVHYVNQSGPWDVESNDRAPVTVATATAPLAAPVAVPAATSANNTWGDYHGGSSMEVYASDSGTLVMETDLGTGWGTGITFWPGSDVPNSDGSVNAAGATKIVARINAPAGATLRFGVLESGAQWSGAPTFEGANGADGEAFRHEGVTTTAGWQEYTIPLSSLKLNGGFGNQHGNRTIDAQALKGIEVLVPGGQQDVVLEIDSIRVE
jgi:hypothetical protein